MSNRRGVATLPTNDRETQNMELLKEFTFTVATYAEVWAQAETYVADYETQGFLVEVEVEGMNVTDAQDVGIVKIYRCYW